jgi:hypothetical protein
MRAITFYINKACLGPKSGLVFSKLTIGRSWVRISSNARWNYVKALAGPRPILVQPMIEMNENAGSQLGHTKKIFFKGFVIVFWGSPFVYLYFLSYLFH